MDQQGSADRGAHVDGVTGRFDVHCKVCGLAAEEVLDTDCREGHVSATVRFGPNVLDGVIYEEGIEGYAVFVVGLYHSGDLRTALPAWHVSGTGGSADVPRMVASVPRLSPHGFASGVVEECTCPADVYKAEVEVDLEELALEGDIQFVVAPITPVGVVPVGMTTHPVRDLALCTERGTTTADAASMSTSTTSAPTTRTTTGEAATTSTAPAPKQTSTMPSTANLASESRRRRSGSCALVECPLGAELRPDAAELGCGQTCSAADCCLAPATRTSSTTAATSRRAEDMSPEEGGGGAADGGGGEAANATATAGEGTATITATQASPVDFTAGTSVSLVLLAVGGVAACCLLGRRSAAVTEWHPGGGDEGATAARRKAGPPTRSQRPRRLPLEEEAASSVRRSAAAARAAKQGIGGEGLRQQRQQPLVGAGQPEEEDGQMRLMQPVLPLEAPAPPGSSAGARGGGGAAAEAALQRLVEALERATAAAPGEGGPSIGAAATAADGARPSASPPSPSGGATTAMSHPSVILEVDAEDDDDSGFR